MYTPEAINVHEFGKLHPFLWNKVNFELTEAERLIKKQYSRLIELSQRAIGGSVGEGGLINRGECKRLGNYVISLAMSDYKRPLDKIGMLTAKSKKSATSFLFDNDTTLEFWCYCAERDVDKTRELAKNSNWDGYEIERGRCAEEKR